MPFIKAGFVDVSALRHSSTGAEFVGPVDMLFPAQRLDLETAEL
jgi:hypothetical protein